MANARHSIGPRLSVVQQLGSSCGIIGFSRYLTSSFQCEGLAYIEKQRFTLYLGRSDVPESKPSRELLLAAGAAR